MSLIEKIGLTQSMRDLDGLTELGFTKFEPIDQEEIDAVILQTGLDTVVDLLASTQHLLSEIIRYERGPEDNCQCSILSAIQYIYDALDLIADSTDEDSPCMKDKQ